MRLRLVQVVLVAAVVIAGARAWRDWVQPPRDALRSLVDAPLRELFGPDVTYDRPFSFDLGGGVTLENLSVPSTGGLETAGGAAHPLAGFTARRVHIAHDPLALAAGRYRPTHIEIEGARVLTHETKEGIAPDFPLHLSAGRRTDGGVPSVQVKDATLLYRAMPGSQRLREHSVVEIHVRELGVRPDEDGTLQVRGDLTTRKLGQDDTVITVRGTVAPDGHDFDVVVRWDPLARTPEMLATLAEKVAEQVRHVGIGTGTLVLRLRPKAGGGALDLHVDWNSEVSLSMSDLPGLEAVDAATREQLEKLFGRGAVQVELGHGRLNIKSLVTELGTGHVRATGWIVRETGEFTIDFEIRDLSLADPALREALGPNGASLYDEFDPRAGLVDAVGRVTRSADGTVDWSVDVILEGADLAYVGDVGPDGRHVGFPYRVRDATGRLRLDPHGVTFDQIVGFNRGAEITILGHTQKAWTGGRTGVIEFTDAGPELHLTVVATHVPTDDRLLAAIRGSEFADMLQTYQIRGVLDRIEVDLTKLPRIERASQAELRLTMEGEQFRYLPFPLPLEDVRGQLTMRRPVLPNGKRGRVYAFDVTGWAEGAPVHVWARIAEHERRGRLHVQAEGLPLAGSVTDVVLASQATSEGLGPVWRWLGPRGRADVNVDLPLSEDPGPMRLDAELRSASLRLDAEGDAPLEIDQLTGHLAVVGGNVTLEDLVGSVGGARVAVHGRLEGGVKGRWALTARIDPLRLTPSLLRSLEVLAPGGALLPGGMQFESGSRLALALDVTKAPGVGTQPEVAFTAGPLDTTLRLADGTTVGLTGTSLSVRHGTVTAHDLRVQAEGVRARVDTLRVVPGADTKITGRFHAAFDDFVLGEGVLGLLPPAVAEVLRRWTSSRKLRSRAFTVDVPEQGPVTLRGDLALVAPASGPIGDGARGGFELDPLVMRARPEGGVVIEGVVRLTDFSLDVGIPLENLRGTIEVEHLALGDKPQGRGRIAGVSGRVAGLSVEDLSAPVDWTRDFLRIPAIGGRVVGGTLLGDFVMHTSQPVSYQGNARVRDFDVARLRDDLAPTGPAYAGRGTARVTFQNRGGRMRDLTGAGVVTIRHGRLGDLPFVANIFTLTDAIVGQGERPQFERADVEFTLQDEVFTFRRFDLAGPLFDMPGTGTLDLTGVIDLRFTPDLVKGLLLPGVMQLPGLGTVLRGLLREELVYAVRVHGDLGSAEPDVVFLPLLGMDRGDDFEGTGARALPHRRLPHWFR